MIVYCITNKINGKQYIGQTVQEVSRRWHRHKTGPYAIGNAIRKYGEENFEISILYRAFEIDALNEAEVELISKYNTVYPNGYNILEGGQIRLGKASIEKMRQTILSKNKKQSPEVVEKRMKNVRRKVTCIEDGISFKSIKDAGEYYGVSPSHITAQCKGKYKGKLKMKTFKYSTGGGLSPL